MAEAEELAMSFQAIIGISEAAETTRIKDVGSQEPFVAETSSWHCSIQRTKRSGKIYKLVLLVVVVVVVNKDNDYDVHV